MLPQEGICEIAVNILKMDDSLQFLSTDGKIKSIPEISTGAEAPLASPGGKLSRIFDS